MAQRWETVEEIAAARGRFEAAIPGWVMPQAYGIGRITKTPPANASIEDGVEFARINVGEHALPAVVMATACGHHTGSASYRLDRAGLGRAIDLLAPAEACTAYEHPNLAAWRLVHASLGEAEEAVAVFVADLERSSDDPYVTALQAKARALNS